MKKMYFEMFLELLDHSRISPPSAGPKRHVGGWTVEVATYFSCLDAIFVSLISLMAPVGAQK